MKWVVPFSIAGSAVEGLASRGVLSVGQLENRPFDPLQAFVQFADMLRQFFDVALQAFVVLTFAISLQLVLTLFGFAHQVLCLFVHPGSVQVLGGLTDVLDLLMAVDISLAFFVTLAFFVRSPLVMLRQLFRFGSQCIRVPLQFASFVGVSLSGMLFRFTKYRRCLISQFVDLAFVGPRSQDKVSDQTYRHRQQDCKFRFHDRGSSRRISLSSNSFVTAIARRPGALTLDHLNTIIVQTPR